MWTSREILGIKLTKQLLFLEPEAMRVRGIIVLVKFNQLVKNIKTKQLKLVKARLKSFFAAKKSALFATSVYNI